MESSIFNEGYLSAHAEQTIRRELCDEAARLAMLLAEHPVGTVPETFALLALMHLHVARLGSRINETGPQDAFMTRLDLLFQIAALLMAVAFFAVALDG